jgi:hypothetical protein
MRVADSAGPSGNQYHSEHAENRTYSTTISKDDRKDDVNKFHYILICSSLDFKLKF